MKLMKAIGHPVLAGIVLGLAVLPTPAHAATFVPCSSADSSAALRAAINAANAAPNGGDIALAPGCTYTLAAPDPGATLKGPSGLPPITGKVRITGANTTIRRSSTAATDFRILYVGRGATLTLNQVTLSGGTASDPTPLGGGIYNDGTLNVLGGSIRHNTALAGGGVASFGAASFTNTSFADNTARNFGGGLFTQFATSTSAVNTSFTRNTVPGTAGGGGAIALSFGGTASFIHITVTGNTAPVGGGLLVAFLQPKVKLVGSRITDNTATGGSVGGTPQTGGGIWAETPSAVTLTGTAVTRNRPDNCRPIGSVPGCPN
ncbi:hypothetical protein [Streptomyces sp. NPDC058695]|uniref:hypothetical protein n=1 Tax=Streptomyces sp. NPDC058695 TaxID=3346604 RepID=UPI00364A5674